MKRVTFYGYDGQTVHMEDGDAAALRNRLLAHGFQGALELPTQGEEDAMIVNLAATWTVQIGSAPEGEPVTPTHRFPGRPGPKELKDAWPAGFAGDPPDPEPVAPEPDVSATSARQRRPRETKA